MLTKYICMFKIHQKISINYLLTEEKDKDWKTKNSKGVYWLFTINWWCLRKFRRLNSTKKRKVLIVYDNMIKDMEATKN